MIKPPFVECFLTAHSGSRVGVPRQFEYHPRVAHHMVVGTMSGDIILLNPRATSPAKRILGSYSSGAMESILGLGWLKRSDNTQRFIAGSDLGAIRMMNTEQMGEGGGVVSQVLLFFFFYFYFFFYLLDDSLFLFFSFDSLRSFLSSQV